MAFVFGGLFSQDVAFERMSAFHTAVTQYFKAFFALDLVFILGMGKLHSLSDKALGVLKHRFQTLEPTMPRFFAAIENLLRSGNRSKRKIIALFFFGAIIITI